MFEGIVRRGTLTAVVSLIICLVSVVAAFRIPIQMIPDLEVRTITVQTVWPGATPRDVEREIAVEQEEFLGSIPGLERMVTTVSGGQAEIALEFPYNVDLTESLIRVNNALSQVPSYPPNVDQPSVVAASFSDNAFMYFRVAPLSGNPQAIDMDMMGRFITDNVRRRLERVPGVSQVEFNGAERQMQVLVDPYRLAERGLRLVDVRDAIVARNRDVSGGDLESGRRNYMLRTVGRYADVGELESTILSRDGDSIVRLSDVATVRLDHFEPGQVIVLNGERALLLALRREAGTNVLAIKRDVVEELDAINREVLGPAGMVMVLLTDDSRYVEDSIANVLNDLWLGALLACGVMFVFLRSLRATLIGIIGIPVCTLAAFLGLLVFGRTINVISLAGVAFAMGMALDNSIVMLDSIDAARRRGLDRIKAAAEGARSVWPAVLATTLTSVLSFVPIVFIREEVGQLYSDVAIAISAASIVSMLVSITIVPTLGAYLLGGEPVAMAGAADDDEPAPHRRYARISVLIDWIIERPARRAACILSTLAVSGWIFFALTPPAEYLPEGEEARIFAGLDAPPGSNLTTMLAIARELEERLRPHLDDEPEEFEAGRSDIPALGTLNVAAEAQGVMIMATTKEPAQIEPLMEAVTRLYDAYPGMSSFAARGSIITSNDGGTRSINLDVSGPDLQAVYQVARTVHQRAVDVLENPRIQTSPPTLSMSQPLIQVHPRWERAAEQGFSADELGFSVAALNDGAYVDRFYNQDEQIDLYLFSDAGQSADPDTLGQLPLHTPRGSIVPLSSVARVDETVDTSSIRRVDGNRTVTISIIPPREIALETGVALVQEQIVAALRDAGDIPSDVRITISGAADQLEATRGSLFSNYGLAILIIYLILVAIFTHWGYPWVIMTTIPLGFAGGIVGLFLLNLVGGLLPMFGLTAISQPFDMISMLGFLILMGAVVNNPILLVDRALENVNWRGFEPVDAVREAVDSRLRAMLVSSATAIVGLLPLVVTPGAGSELYRGVGAIVLFGIMGSVIVTLTFLPALTVMALNWRKHRQKVTQVAPAE